MTSATRRIARMLAEADCARCSLACEDVAARAVGGFGPRDAALVVVGEAPGYREVASGVPFSGASGALLWDELRKRGIERTRVYSTNALLCTLPPDSLLKAKDLKACNGRLAKELSSLLTPKVILCLGSSAATAVRGSKSSMAVLSGRSEWSDTYGAHVAFAYHPAAVLHNPSYYIDFIAGLRNALALLDAAPGPRTPEEITYDVLDTPDAACSRLDALQASPVVACDLETTGLDPFSDRILEIGFADTPTHATLLPATLLAHDAVRDAARRLLENDRVRWVYHNGKFDTQMLRAVAGIEARVGSDTLLLHYCLDERSGDAGGFHDLKRLAHAYCGAAPYGDEIDGSRMEEVPESVRRPYHARDCVYTFRLWSMLASQAAHEPASRFGYPMPREVHDRLLIPATNLLADIELRGVRVDTERLKTLHEEYAQMIERQREVVTALVPEPLRATPTKRPFNPNSTVQILRVLRSMEHYPPVASTNKETMHDLQRLDAQMKRPVNPFLESVLTYRSLLHTKTTYLDGITRRLKRGRLHSSFGLHNTTSGRLSSRDPNLQNLPKDSVVKELFIASEGRVLCEADYRRLEVGVLAWYSRDSKLIADFAASDFHWNVAQSIFPDIVASMENARGYILPLEDICSEHAMFADFARRQSHDNERTNDPQELYDWLKTRLRRQAKYVSFGIMYGEGAEALSGVEKGLGVSVTEAAQFIRAWKAAYPQAVRYLDAQVTHARQSRWVESASGRRRRFLYPSKLQTHIANEAMNHSVQALASDLCLLAMIDLNRQLPASGLGDVLLSVHDSILFEIDAARTDEAVTLIHEVMTGVLRDTEIAFEIDVALGPNWGALSKYEGGLVG